MKIHPHRLADLAKLIDAKYIGSPDMLVTGINEVHLVEEGDLMFVDHPKYYEKALTCAATFILINKEIDCPEGKALIFSDDPFRDYNFLVRHFRPVNHSPQPINASAKVGEDTVIYPNVYIGPEVTIGKRCVLMPGVVIYGYTTIGDDVTIHANTVIGSDAYYYKRRPDSIDKMISCGGVVIHDQVEIGACCTIDRGVSGNTSIGRGTKLDNHIHLGHDVSIGALCIIAASVGIAGVSKVGDGVTIWGQVGVGSAVEIGAGAVVQAQSGVTKSLEGGKVYFGTPAEETKVKMRELVALRQLPQVLEKLKSES